MPQPGVQLLLILSAVPLQFLISKWMTPMPVDREYYTRRLFSDTINTFRKLCNITEWKLFLIDLEKHVLSPDSGGECAAKEVMMFNEPNGYFAGSPEPKTTRGNVKYRVGQIIKHKKFGYRGVIVGWDYKAKAPDHWLQVNHFDPSWRAQPNYSILVDTRDRTDVQTTYVVEENIDIITDSQIEHPDVEAYFGSFDQDQYTPRPWLKELYPRD